MELEYYTKVIGAITASTAMIGGGYTLADKFGVFHKDILKWAPEHFQISDAPANGEFKAVVARQKIRDDCEVTLGLGSMDDHPSHLCESRRWISSMSFGRQIFHSPPASRMLRPHLYCASLTAPVSLLSSTNKTPR